MNWPDEDPLESVRPLVDERNRLESQILDSIFGGLRQFVDESCPRGILWFRGGTILRFDARSHDAHLGAVGGE